MTDYYWSARRNKDGTDNTYYIVCENSNADDMQTVLTIINRSIVQMRAPAFTGYVGDIKLLRAYAQVYLAADDKLERENPHYE